MKKTLLAVAAAATLVLTAGTPAHAQRGVAAGVAAGIIGGAIVGGALASPYYYGPGPGYAYGPGYGPGYYPPRYYAPGPGYVADDYYGDGSDCQERLLHGLDLSHKHAGTLYEAEFHTSFE